VIGGQGRSPASIGSLPHPGHAHSKTLRHLATIWVPEPEGQVNVSGSEWVRDPRTWFSVIFGLLLFVRAGSRLVTQSSPMVVTAGFE
jgi:hypothetical protein